MTKTTHAASVQVTRGDRVESIHAVDIVVADAEGSILQSWGDPSREIYPRSSVKSLQALSLIESGAADALGLSDQHLALACSSHNGEAIHVETAREILAHSGIAETCLECGAQNPELAIDFAELVRSGVSPSDIHNNCSGKHSGFLAFASYAGIPVRGYINFEHQVQREIASVLEAVIGTPHRRDNYAIDGCSIPTFTTPLDRLAVAYAKFGLGMDQSKARASAMIRLRDACMKKPYLVAGKKRVCTNLMRVLKGRAFVKVGAEGVYTACLPELGLGIALKVRDGTRRAAEVAVSSVIESLLDLDGSEKGEMSQFVRPILTNRNNMKTGEMR